MSYAPEGATGINYYYVVVVVDWTECPYVDGVYDLAMLEELLTMKGVFEMKFACIVKQSVWKFMS
jgi:hypothetical protein